MADSSTTRVGLRPRVLTERNPARKARYTDGCAAIVIGCATSPALQCRTALPGWAILTEIGGQKAKHFGADGLAQFLRINYNMSSGLALGWVV